MEVGQSFRHLSFEECFARDVSGRILVGMPIAVLTVELRLEFAHSLKDRRQCVRSMKDSLRHGFNVSVAELDEIVVWQRATLGIAAISSSRDYLLGQMRQVEEACIRIAENHGAQVSDSFVEMFPEE